MLSPASTRQHPYMLFTSMFLHAGWEHVIGNMVFYARVTLVPALAFIGVWFVSQLFREVGTIAGAQSDGVADAAHIGGVVFGATTARLFEAGSRRNRLEFQHGPATVR